MPSPYKPPEPPISTVDGAITKRRGGRKTAILGLILFAGPFLGVLLTAFFMVETFNQLSAEGSEPAGLAENISGATRAAIISLFVGIAGFVVILFALLKFKNRETWFFYNSVIMASLWCLLMIPLGLFFGGAIIIMFIKRKPEFFPPAVTDWDTKLSGEQ